MFKAMTTRAKSLLGISTKEKRGLRAGLLACSVVSLMGAANATADTIHLDLAGSPVAVGSDYRWTYNVSESSTTLSSVQPSMFTMLDVSGLVLGSSSYTPLAGHTFNLFEENLTTGPSIPHLPNPITIASIGGTDSSAVWNIRGVYTGPASTGTVPLGILTFLSVDGVIAHGLQQVSYDINGTKPTLSIYTPDGPGAGLGPPNTPLPLASLGGLGLLGLLAFKKRALSSLV